MNDKEQDKSKENPPSIWRTIWDGFLEGEKDALRFGRAGVIVGALLGAGAGIYFFEYFGLVGVGVGLVTGAVIGGVGLWLMHQLA